MSFRVTSPAFSDGGAIPKKYSCDGEDVSPPLEWHGLPEATRSLAVVCDDPDAPNGVFTHWVLYDIPPTTQTLEEGTVDRGKAGVSSFGKSGYGGPCPPHGPAHHYAFHVYALDVPSLGKPALTKEALVEAMSGHVLDEGTLVGEYRRQRR